jgi:O-acetyl-ADP-ribose deacetylase
MVDTNDEVKIGNTVLRLWKGNIVEAGTEAIVNAANSALAGGNGVDGAIHRAAGADELRALTRPFGGCPTGSAVITGAAKMALPTRYIIHAVGPIYNPANQKESARLLTGAYRKSLELAEEKGVKSVAFPAISTGAYCYPQRDAAKIALTTVKKFVTEAPRNLELVLFVLFSERDLTVYRQMFTQIAE